MAINKQNKKVPRMPNDLVAESAVLGCMLINNNSVSKAIQILEPDSFYDFKNKVIDKKGPGYRPFGMSEAADYEPTTADEYNDKWVNEQRRRGNVTGDAK